MTAYSKLETSLNVSDKSGPPSGTPFFKVVQDSGLILLGSRRDLPRDDLTRSHNSKGCQRLNAWV
ncbi:hypothetical protein SBA1_640021 [Candidatus Sulfotelmatobacter kueseliae]|uniref:Uncharacterized protein n=1 Tax=Candidatus Sulfotelmatobacter kueseliae TaxID=2042962 RepID=A0A2U3L2S8_9BACT|nr:hypothetical protein SBA1_640021 [Candidatus Sulfotelmatobacter kueseliae]